MWHCLGRASAAFACDQPLEALTVAIAPASVAHPARLETAVAKLENPSERSTANGSNRVG